MRNNITNQTLFNIAGTHNIDYKLELKLYSYNQLLKLKKMVEQNLFNDPYGKKVSYTDYDHTRIMNLIIQELRHRKLEKLLK